MTYFECMCFILWFLVFQLYDVHSNSTTDNTSFELITPLHYDNFNETIINSKGFWNLKDFESTTSNFDGIDVNNSQIVGNIFEEFATHFNKDDSVNNSIEFNSSVSLTTQKSIVSVIGFESDEKELNRFPNIPKQIDETINIFDQVHNISSKEIDELNDFFNQNSSIDYYFGKSEQNTWDTIDIITKKYESEMKIANTTESEINQIFDEEDRNSTYLKLNHNTPSSITQEYFTVSHENELPEENNIQNILKNKQKATKFQETTEITDGNQSHKKNSILENNLYKEIHNSINLTNVKSANIVTIRKNLDSTEHLPKNTLKVNLIRKPIESRDEFDSLKKSDKLYLKKSSNHLTQSIYDPISNENISDSEINEFKSLEQHNVSNIFEENDKNENEIQLHNLKDKKEIGKELQNLTVNAEEEKVNLSNPLVLQNTTDPQKSNTDFEKQLKVYSENIVGQKATRHQNDYLQNNIVRKKLRLFPTLRDVQLKDTNTQTLNLMEEIVINLNKNESLVNYDYQNAKKRCVLNDEPKCFDCKTMGFCNDFSHDERKSFSQINCAIQTNNERSYCDFELNKCVSYNTCEKEEVANNKIDLCPEKDGFYPDPLDCKKYLKCETDPNSGAVIKTKHACPLEAPVYQAGTQNCGYFQCVDMHELCNENGRRGKLIQFPLSPNIYGKCPERTKLDDKISLFKCPKNYTFNEEVVSCEPKCESEGFIQTLYDCRSFYLCRQLKSLRKFYLEIQTCPSGFRFNPDKSICAMSYKCNTENNNRIWGNKF